MKNEELREKIESILVQVYLAGSVDDSETQALKFGSGKIMELINQESKKARIEELERASKSDKLEDIYGEDWRAHYGYNETQVRDAVNHIRKDIAKRIAQLKKEEQ